ncbi:YciI family protein [Conexibacter stalactiti]|uniref:YciI family protein n=1 Tax=Conexibacter stalactiti TaxID=1940611 RepID=A0ABU4HIH2_9ACTN|nr:YciI family protein [Conexibacter stalactiti]MDW5593109.1 YciI family protein [Conexibacter stalactiti]MEC5033750.1 YciI family protein [Conexibacter stalactiti]
MKVMVIVKSNGADEEKIEPTTEMFEAMGAYNEQLVKAGVMLDGDGLKPSRAGAQVVFQGGRTSVVDGPFTESKEVIGGYWVWEVRTLEEAIEWAKRCPSDHNGDVRSLLEIRPYATMEDFGDALTPELQDRETQLAEQLKTQRGEA